MSRPGDTRLARIEALFDRVHALPEAERRAALDAAAPDDPALRDEFEVLVRLRRRAAEWADALAGDLSDAAARELSTASGVGRTFGHYRTLRRIGAGGMGTVFLAERSDGQFQRRVALKLIRRGLESEEAVRRFLRERQILARLDHPGIARLLDGGITDDGLPFYVMEHVEGEPLDAYCDAHGLDVDARLGLFLQVADAVQFLHGHLVVHRDLKPANVLVTPEGRVKLLDFGIAKLLGEETSDGTPETRARALTPQYAAPEQIRGERVTTATDVFALGVMLYELLAGTRPFERAGRSMAALERALLEEEPEPPSARVAGRPGDGGAPGGSVHPRGARPGRLRRRLRGDLDTICLAALRKEPERRYRSAEQLAEDVRRHLATLPVVARRDTGLYRTRKFVRRHAVEVAAAAVVAALLAGSGVVARRQAERVAQERDRAERVSELLVDVFRVADPGEGGAEGLDAREVLDRGAARLDRELRGHPETRVELLSVVGEVYRNLGLYDDAAARFEEALAVREAAAEPDPSRLAPALARLGDLRRLQGRYGEADSLLRSALALESGRGRESDPLATARMRDRLGLVRLAQGDLEGAADLFQDALARNRRLGDDAEVAENLVNLAAVAFARGRWDEAAPLFREGLALRRRALGDGHPDVAATLSNLAAALARSGAYAEAEAAQSEGLEIYRELLGDEHPRVATMLNNLGLLRLSVGDAAGAEAPLRRSLELRRRLLEAAHPDLGQSLTNLGLVLTRLGRFEEARPLYEEALAGRRATLGPEHPLVAQTLHNLGLLHQAQGEHDLAERRLREGLAMLRRTVGEGHPWVATGLSDLAALLHDRGELTEAERHYREALARRREILPPGHLYTAHTLAGLGSLLLDAGRAEAAEPLLREARDIRAAALPPDHPDLAAVEARLARAREAPPPPR